MTLIMFLSGARQKQSPLEIVGFCQTKSDYNSKQRIEQMKVLLTTLFLLIGTSAMAGTPIETAVPVDNIYSPSGFHDHEESEVIITGHLPNLCHKSPKTKVRVVGGEIQINVTALHYLPSNPFCATVLVPFVETVQVGLLDKGDYSIVVNPGTPFERRGELGIEDYASSAIGDVIFANVSHVEKTGMNDRVILKGYNPSDCFELDEISYRHNKKDTYSVYPKMKQVSEFCPRKMIPFSYEFEVPSDLERQKVLLHVKAMDGKSVNTIYSQEALTH